MKTSLTIVRSVMNDGHHPPGGQILLIRSGKGVSLAGRCHLSTEKLNSLGHLSVRGKSIAWRRNWGFPMTIETDT
jgi:hypothetical protein